MRGRRILVSSGTMHAVPEAVGLRRAGHSVTLATSLCFRSREAVEKPWIPGALKRRFSARVFPELREVRLRRLLVPEIVHRILCAAGWGSQSRRFKIHNELLDRRVSAWIEGYEVFHFVNGTGLFSARKAAKRGLTIVLSQRAAHPAAVAPLVAEEYGRLGLPYEHPEASFMERVLEEQELAARILVPSTYCRESFEQQDIAPSKLLVVPLGFNPARFGAAARKNSGGFRILYVGSVTPEKGLRFLLEAYARADLPGAELLLVGEMHPAMASMVGRAGGRVRWLPHVPQTDLAEIYRSAAVFVSPSLSDGWGFTVLEAMASSLPVIVTRNTGARDALSDGREGFVVPPGDPEAIAERLWRLFRDEGERVRMGEQAALRAASYSWPAYFERLGSAYREILEPKRDNGHG